MSPDAIMLRPFREEDFTSYQAWFRAAAECFVAPPDETWLRHVIDDPASEVWVALRDGRIVAIIQADWDSAIVAAVCIVVAPALRGRGIGTETLRTWLAEAGSKFSAVDGYVEPDNAASLRCADRCGFVPMSAEPDDEGFVHLRFQPMGNAPI